METKVVVEKENYCFAWMRFNLMFEKLFTDMEFELFLYSLFEKAGYYN